VGANHQGCWHQDGISPSRQDCIAQVCQRIATLKRMLAAFNAHDLDGVMQFFSEDCVLKMPRGPKTVMSVSRR
jgi:hypothetical protein